MVDINIDITANKKEGTPLQQSGYKFDIIACQGTGFPGLTNAVLRRSYLGRELNESYPDQKYITSQGTIANVAGHSWHTVWKVPILISPDYARMHVFFNYAQTPKIYTFKLWRTSLFSLNDFRTVTWNNKDGIDGQDLVPWATPGGDKLELISTTVVPIHSYYGTFDFTTYAQSVAPGYAYLLLTVEEITTNTLTLRPASPNPTILEISPTGIAFDIMATIDPI